MAFGTSMLARLALGTSESDQSNDGDSETYLQIESNGHVHAEFVPVSSYLEGLCRSMQCLVASDESYEIEKGHLASRAITSIHSSTRLTINDRQGLISKNVTRRSKRRSINHELSKSLDIANMSPRRRRQEIPTKMF